MVWDCHFNLLEHIWMLQIVAWSFLVFITFPRNEKKAARTGFRGAHVQALIWLNFFVWLPNIVPFITFVFNNLPINASFN
jgi:hypothetical protein